MYLRREKLAGVDRVGGGFYLAGMTDVDDNYPHVLSLSVPSFLGVGSPCILVFSYLLAC